MTLHNPHLPPLKPQPPQLLILPTVQPDDAEPQVMPPG